MNDREILSNALKTEITKYNSHHNRDVVVIIGPPGSGKATLINYMLGHQLKIVNLAERFDPAVELENPEHNNAALIHHGSIYQELRRPYLYADHESNLSFCKFNAGIHTESIDNEEARIINMFNSALVRSIRKFKAVFLTLSLSGMTGNKGEIYRQLVPFVELAQTMTEQQKQSIFIVFTRNDCVNATRQKLVEHFISIIDYLQETDNPNAEACTEYRFAASQMIMVLNFLVELNQNYLFINPTDPLTRDMVIQRLYQSPPIPSVLLDFCNFFNVVYLSGRPPNALIELFSGKHFSKHLKVVGRTEKEDLENLVIALNHCPNIRHLFLISNRLDHSAIDPIVRLIESSTTLETLDIRNNQLGPEMLRIVQALARNSTITRMCLTQNDAGANEQDLQTISDAHCRRNQSYHLSRPACVFFARIRKDPGVASTFSLLSRDVLFKIFSYCSDLYTRDNLATLYTSLLGPNTPTGQQEHTEGGFLRR